MNKVADRCLIKQKSVCCCCRLPLYSTMELFIETLTGTCFELRVSPYETVISVKAKIQRLEGLFGCVVMLNLLVEI